MIACVRLPHWVAAIERQHDPALTTCPLVIGGHAWEAAPVQATSPEAAAAGVRIGMPLKQAGALCPDAHFLPPNEALYRAAYDTLLDLLWQFSDRLEPPEGPFTGPDSAFFLDLGRLQATEAHRLATQLLAALAAHCNVTARIGLATNRFTARAAALTSPESPAVIPPGQEAALLAPLPVTLLPLDSWQAHRLALLGIRTLGQFAALPAHTMLTQFGIQGPLLHRLARGIDDRPVAAILRPRTETLHVECEPPVNNRLRLQTLLTRLSARLGTWLHDQGMTCAEVGLTVELRGGTTVTRRHRPREAVAEGDELLRLALRLLDEMALSGPVYGLSLQLRGLQPLQMRQLALFETAPATRPVPPAILERLAARHGRDLFYAIRQADAPRNAYLPETFQLASVVA